MAMVQILNQTYTLPEIANERFHRLQEQVRARQRLIQEGGRRQSRLWGFLPHTSVMLSEEERFRELELLVGDYDAIIARLKEGKDTYETFFTQLVAGIRQAVKRKSDEIRQLEQERAALHQSAVAQQDSALEQWATQSAEQLLQSVRLLGQAMLILLRRVGLVWGDVDAPPVQPPWDGFKRCLPARGPTPRVMPRALPSAPA